MKGSSRRFAPLLAALPSPDGLAAQRRAARSSSTRQKPPLPASRRRSCPQSKTRRCRDVLRRRPEHEVCGIGDSALKTARIVLVTHTFEGPVLPATQNKLSFTMRHAAPPRPPAGRGAQARRPHQKSSLIFQRCSLVHIEVPPCIHRITSFLFAQQHLIIRPSYC